MSHSSKVMSMDLTQKEKHVMKRFLKELERAEKYSLIGIGNLVEKT